MKAISFTLSVWVLSLLGGCLIVTLYLYDPHLTGTFIQKTAALLALYSITLLVAFIISIPAFLIESAISFVLFKYIASVYLIKAIISLTLAAIIFGIYCCLEGPRSTYPTVTYADSEYKDVYIYAGYWVVATIGILAIKIKPDKSLN